jgi:hypothetical protein
MKPSLQQLLPADISNETAFQLVQFIRGLAFALESIYFDNMLLHNSECGQDPIPDVMSDENPF